MAVCFVYVLKFRIYLIPCISKVSFFEWVAGVMVKKTRKNDNALELSKVPWGSFSTSHSSGNQVDGSPLAFSDSESTLL